MKKLILFTALSTSCAHTPVATVATDFYLPDGSMAAEAFCVGPGATYARCLKLVNKYCKNKPYDILSIENTGTYLNHPPVEERGKYDKLYNELNITITFKCVKPPTQKEIDANARKEYDWF